MNEVRELKEVSNVQCDSSAGFIERLVEPRKPKRYHKPVKGNNRCTRISEIIWLDARPTITTAIISPNRFLMVLYPLQDSNIGYIMTI